MESREESNQPDDSINTNCKFTAVRFDLRHLTSSVRHGPRSHVFVISDDTSGLEVKRMVAEKIGLSDDVASQMELIATSDLKSPEKKGNAKSEYLVSDDSCLLDVYRVSSDRRPTVSFSLKWRNELMPSKSSYMSPSILHNVNSTPDQDLYPGQISETTDRKSSDGISYTNGSNIPGYRKTGNFPTVDLGTMDNPVKRLHSSSSSTSSWRSDRSKNECIIHYEPQNISSKTDLRISNFHSMADPELRTTTSSRPTSYDGHLKTPRTSKSLETGSYGSPLISSTTRSSHDPQNSNNSIIRLPAAGSLTRGERNSLDDAVGISSSFQTFCPVVPPGKTTSGDSDQGGDMQRETKFSSLPNMEQMTEAQRCRVGAHPSVSVAASSSSLPCISTTEGGLVGVGRRCLPQLCIPEEIVEEKRNLLSKRLEKKLQSADRKKKLRRRRSDMTQRNVAEALHSPNGRIDGTEEERRRRVSAGNNESDDDDCKSVTSWEVAEILASADPMAPQDSDYEDSPPSTDDDKVTSVFKSCRVTTSSPSDADTLDGSSNEADKRDEPPNDFSPIHRYARSSAPNVQSKLDFRSHLTSENHVASVKPVAISNKTLQAADLHTTANNSIPANSIRVIKNPTKASPTSGLSLFKLLRNGDFRFRTSVLCQSRRLSSAVRKLDRLPFEIFNDVIQLNSAQKGSVREKFTVPVIGDGTEEPDWECLEGSIETGDIVVEVNGHLVLNRPSSEVITTCLSSSKNLQFLLARQRRTKK